MMSACHCVASSGAVLLDLKQRTLPGIAQQVVEQMVISDQIKAEDRANVLRALLLRHRSIHQPVNQSINQSVSQSINQSVSQSVRHFVHVFILYIFIYLFHQSPQ